MIGIAKRTLRKIIKGQQGQALAIVLVLLGVGGLLIMPTLGLGYTSLKGHQVTERKTMEFYAADSGVEDALYWLTKGRRKEGPWTGWYEEAGYGERDRYSINDAFVDVNVQRLAARNTYKITSTATSPSGSTTVVLSTVWAISYFEGGHEFNNQDPPPPGDIWVDGDATIAGNIEVTGTFIATGSVTTMNNAQITGDLLILGDMTLDNNCEIHGTLCCGGNIMVGNNCLIDGDIHLLGEDGTIALTQAGAEVQGNIWADGNVTIDIKLGSASKNEIWGNVYAPGGVYPDPTGNIVIYLRDPNARISGDVYARGTISILEDNGSLGESHIHEDYSGDPPFDCPQCPDFPDRRAIIYTYEIT